MNSSPEARSRPRRNAGPTVAPNHDRPGLCKQVARFTGHAIRWLTFLGRLQPPAVVATAVRQSRRSIHRLQLRERGLSPRTVAYASRTIHEFLAQVEEAGLRLKTLTVAQVDELLAKKVREEGYARNHHSEVGVELSVRSSGSRKDAAGAVTGLAAAIMAPRVFRHEGLPLGPSWDDVKRLLAAAREGAARRHPRSCPADAAGGVRPSCRRSHGPAAGGLRLGAGGADRPARQVDSGRGPTRCAVRSAMPSSATCGRCDPGPIGGRYSLLCWHRSDP